MIEVTEEIVEPVRATRADLRVEVSGQTPWRSGHKGAIPEREEAR